MIIDCIPDHMKYKIYLELKKWFIRLDVNNISRPDRIKLLGNSLTDDPELSFLMKPDRTRNMEIQNEISNHGIAHSD